MNRWTVRRWWRRLRRLGRHQPSGTVTVTITADTGPYLEALARVQTLSTSSTWTWVRSYDAKPLLWEGDQRE